MCIRDSYYGGVVYMYNSDTVFNMNGGTIRNGRAYARNEKCGPWGGNVYLQSGTFNRYGGTIENGKAFTGTVTVTNKDGSTSDKLMRGSGGNFYVSSSAKLNIMGGSVVGGWAGDDGYGGNIAAATAVGKLVAERALEKGIDTVVFDRGGYLYHGRVKALAEGAREGGLKF